MKNIRTYWKILEQMNFSLMCHNITKQKKKHRIMTRRHRVKTKVVKYKVRYSGCAPRLYSIRLDTLGVHQGCIV